jgi:hypothetical protein
MVRRQAIQSPRGNFPLAQPIIMFATMMTITAVIINARDDDGRPSLERVVRVHRLPNGAAAAAGRLGAWVSRSTPATWCCSPRPSWRSVPSWAP